MKVQEIKDFLVLLLNKELEEEERTTNNKEWIVSCIYAKRWLMDKKGIMGIVTNEIIKEDIERYITNNDMLVEGDE